MVIAKSANMTSEQATAFLSMLQDQGKASIKFTFFNEKSDKKSLYRQVAAGMLVKLTVQEGRRKLLIF